MDRAMVMIVIGIVLLAGAAGGGACACAKYEKIRPGYVGVSVKTCGDNRGVSATPIPNGIYWRELVCEDVIEYPVSSPKRRVMTRSAQDILAERRSVIREQRRETDKTAIAILQFQIDELDRELAKVSVRTERAVSP